MKILNRWRLSSLILWLLGGQLFASDHDHTWFQQTEWDAFVSQSAIYSSDFNFMARSDDRVSFDMWEAGLLASTKVIGDLSFSAQILGRKISESSDEDIRIDYGFFSYPFYQAPGTSLGLRFGRIRSSYGFYNETRDIPHTRTGILMPQAVYFDMTRNSYYSADGLELFGFRDFGDQRLAFQVYFSRPVADEDETQNAEGLGPSNLEGDKGFLAKIEYGSEIDGLRAAFTYFRPEYDVDVFFSVGDSPPVEIDENNATFYSEAMVSSLEYNSFEWTFTLEYLRHKFHTDIPALGDIPGLDAEGDFYEEAFYAQGIYRFHDQWETYLRYEQTRVRGSEFDNVFFDDVNIGLSFRPDSNWLIRAEFHYIEGVSRLLSRDNTYRSDQDPYWTAAMLQVAYRW